MHDYLAVLKKYTQFSGRSHRREFWMFCLINILIAIVLGFVDGVTGMTWNSGHNGLLSTIYSLAVLLPGLAVLVRRLHDTDRSGWWLLLLFIPIVGALVILMFLCLQGQQGSNRFGGTPIAN